MRLPRRTLSFDRITHHAKVTQCLGGLQQDPWYMAVSEPFKPPTKDSIKVFKIPHGKVPLSSLILSGSVICRST